MVLNLLVVVRNQQAKEGKQFDAMITIMKHTRVGNKSDTKKIACVIFGFKPDEYDQSEG